MLTRIAAPTIAALLGLLAVPAPAQDEPLVPQSPLERDPVPEVVPAEPDAAPELAKADVDAWLDGYMPYAIAQGDVAGAVVVIVRDGEILTQRGFGFSDVEAREPVDPETTMFRPGSVSKLFTWTAVMQLVEQGRIDLDTDVNQYLDFEIPPRDGEPITMRQIMTHTPGFEEAVRNIIVWDRPIEPLDQTLKRWVPARIFPPGTTPAYSNYATALAGYIVERQSGLPFDDYVAEKIFGPLDMQYSTFRQPLPDHLAPHMSNGYLRASGEAMPYELVALAPAGSAAASGTDMAKFMMAHLDEGGPLMNRQTARQMHEPGKVVIPGLNRMALGFYEQQVNGQSAIGHGGDTVFFHSYLWLFPQENAGMFVSLNSAGKEGVTLAIRTALFDHFADRYFPAPEKDMPGELETAADHARLLAGGWWNSRRSESGFLRALQLVSQVNVGVDVDGRPTVDVLPAPGGAPRTWIEVEPFLWRDADGQDRLGAEVENGEVVRWSIYAETPFMVFERPPWYLNAAWLLPALLFGLFVLATTVLAWPIGALARRHYGVSFMLEGKQLTAHRLVRGFSLAAVLVLAGWAFAFAILMSNFNLHGSLTWLIVLLQIGSLAAFFGLMLTTAWNLLLTWIDDRGWFARLWSALLVLAAFFALWVALGFNLISFGTDF